MFVSDSIGADSRFDAVLVGAGIMSSTLAVLLHELDPEMRILIVERLTAPALESSSPSNNSGTGHAANCEFNYTPLLPDGSLQIDKALSINAAFERSLELWASLTELGRIVPATFLNLLPHISFARSERDIDILRKRFSQLSSQNAFEGMEFTQDKGELTDWMPIVMEGRHTSEKVAATRIERGTDIDFGALTRAYLDSFAKSRAVKVSFATEVVGLQKLSGKTWNISLKNDLREYSVETNFVFLGAGGGALSLLQKSEIPESKFYGGFPVSGQWLICNEDQLVHRHKAKVYGNAESGAPPMSVPHLDTRWINGTQSLLFGPFAGFNTKFLKHGSRWDLFRSIQLENLGSMIQVGVQNVDLIKYLLSQLQQDHMARIDVLNQFLPLANPNDWELAVAGQRVQIIKRTPNGGKLKMGTEVVSSSDGSLAALLGASPGASTAVSIMLEVLTSCWDGKMSTNLWQERLKKLLPSFGQDYLFDKSLFKETRHRNDSLLGFGK